MLSFEALGIHLEAIKIFMMFSKSYFYPMKELTGMHVKHAGLFIIMYYFSVKHC